MNPKLSVIVPIYNVEKHLSRCLKSLINQTFKDIEIICVNDGSTDNSLEILSEYAQEDKRIKIISKNNSGPADSRGCGLAKSEGEFISFIDSDDWIEPNTYELVLSNMTNEIDIASFGVNIAIDNDYELDELKNKKIDDFKNYFTPNLKGKNDINEQTILNTTMFIWNKIFRKKIIEKYNIKFLPNLLCAEDFGFLYKYLYSCNNIYFMENQLYNYLQRNNSTMSQLRGKKFKNLCDNCLSGEDIYKFLKSNNILEKNLNSFLHIFHMCFYTDYICCHEENYNLFFEKAKNIALNIKIPEVKVLFIDELINDNFEKCVEIVKRMFNHAV